MVANKWIKQMYGYVSDINVEEIASHIANNNLKEWIESWGASFRNIIRSVNSCYEEAEGWIYVGVNKPDNEEIVQLLIYDDHYDSPDTYTISGWRLNDVWITDNELVSGTVVAWKPLQTALSANAVEDLGWV